MQAYSCMLCKKSNREFINICYKNGRNSVKDDILELCGNSVVQYLGSDDLVCSKCMRILDSAAKLKRQVYEIILDYGGNRKVAGKPATKDLEIEISHDSDYEDSTEDSSNTLPRTPPKNFHRTSSPRNCTGTSPDNLLLIKSSVPFDQRSDTDMEEANNKYRYYERDTPILDREVQRANFRGRRRSRGHNWTRRKGSQRSRSYSHGRSKSQYSKYGRNSAHSRYSRASTASKKKQIQQQSQLEQSKRILGDFLYQKDSLGQFTRAYLNRHGEIIDDLSYDFEWNNDIQKPVIKTRYASELRSRLLNEYEQLIYECPVNSCQQILFNLEQITEHRVKEHNEMALFWCEQCKFSYLSQEHLDRHKDEHYQKFISYCIYCSEEFRNKKLYEEHLNEHLIHSFPCIYCDKFFLRKQICENHIREAHPGRKKKIKRIKPQSILDRIDKYPGSKKDELKSSKTANSSQEFVVKILWQHGQTEDNCASNEEDPLDSNCEELNNEDFMDICEPSETNVDTLLTSN